MNFKKNVVPPTKKPLFNGYGNEYMMQQPPRRSVSLLTLFVVIICTFILALVLFRNYDRISNWFSSSVESTTGFQIWQQVALSGMLQANGDLVSYTHTLTLADTTIVGLKSRTLDLSIYSGLIDIQWTVEKELNDIYIVEVSFVSWALASTWTTWVVIWSGSGIYISQAGIYLPADFGTKYTLLNNWENGELRVQNIATNQIIAITYFACKKTDPNKNCSQLQQNIWGSAEKTLSTSYGITLYKLEWVTSWFFANGNYYGYFINDIPEQEVIDVTNALILPSDYYVQNTLLPKLQALCTDGLTSLMQVTTHSLGVDLNWLYADLQWPTADGSATCKVFIDPSQAAWGTKISYISNTPTVSGNTATTTPTTTTPTTTTSTIDTSVKQFPINLAKAMTYTSNKWYSVVFPSSNIAYDSSNVDEDLGLPGVRCSTQMNVIKYSDKANLDVSPTVKVFSCNIKGTLSNLWNSIIQKTAANGMNFLIQIIDPARADFANNIAIN